MPWTNYHSHTHFCDGKLGPEAYAAEAARQGLWAYGFSSHAPLPYNVPWGMRPESVAAYLAQVARLQADYQGKLELYVGLEVGLRARQAGAAAPLHP
jgi:histidinol-phosphatase (PHP family)